MVRNGARPFDRRQLPDLHVIFEAKPLKDTDKPLRRANGVLPDGTFALTIGEGFEYREAQDLSSDLQIVRLGRITAFRRTIRSWDRPSVRKSIPGAIATNRV